VPVYKQLGGKLRDQVRVYNGGVRFQMGCSEPEHYAKEKQQMKDSPEDFSIIKIGIAYLSPIPL